MKSNNFKELYEVLNELPLGEKEKYVGIYGMGLHRERLLQKYQADIGEVKAKLIFIDSNKETLSGRYKDCDIYNVRDIGNLPLDAVILSSFLYEKEMYQMLGGCTQIDFQFINFMNGGRKRFLISAECI